ncbi:hypothetical protein [Streptococcus constellatus]
MKNRTFLQKMLYLHLINIIADLSVYIDSQARKEVNFMAKIFKYQDVLNSAEYAKEQVVVDLRKGSFIDKDEVERHWVHLYCVDAVLFANAKTLDIDTADLPTLTVKIKNADTRDWSSLIDRTIDVSSAVVVSIINNNQLKGLALSIECSNLEVI